MSAVIQNNEKAKFNARIFAICQAFAGINQAATVSMGGVIGSILAPIPWLITLPITTFVLGVALTSYPASQLMGRIGRRNGFLIGGGAGIVGNLICALAVYIGDFYLFCLGTALVGSYGAFGQLYRFAATDMATPDFKPRVMSWVLIGGIFAALGPEIVNLTQGFIIGVPYVSAYIAIAATALCAIFCLSFLDFPPVQKQQDTKYTGRTVREFLKTPAFLMAVFAGAAGYSLMNLVMTAAPIAMIACEHPSDLAFRGITLHVFAMFAPSFFTGKLMAKYGASEVTKAGFIMLIACAVIGLAGISLAHFWIGLILLGVGWNFSYLGASAMITELHSDEEKSTAQGLNDAMVMGTVVIASISSGALFNQFGWASVVGIVIPIALIGILLVIAVKRQQAKAVAA